MAKVITFTNQKGGVGKTTTACAFCGMFSMKHKKVLAIDLDPQGNLSFSLGADSSGVTIHDVLLGKASIHEAIVETKTCDVIPSNILLSGIELELVDEGREYALKEKLSSIRKFYDYIIIDTPPALSILTINAYAVADDLIVPMTAEILSLQGVSQLRETIFAVKKYYNSKLCLKGILLTRYNARNTLSNDVLEMAEIVASQLGTKVVEAKISTGVAAGEAPAHQMSVVQYAPKSAVAKNYNSAINELYGEEI